MTLARLIDLLPQARKVGNLRPWPRFLVDEEGWLGAARALAARRATLLGLWADGAVVHMALLDEAAREVAVITHDCRDGSFASIGALHPPALRLERAIRSLHGLEPRGLPDTRPWIDLGCFERVHPLAASPSTVAAEERKAYVFLPAEGEGLHQIPVGPVHAGIIEPGHFRFTANGETVVRLEQRLGYVHKGIEGLLRGAALDKSARLASRISGDSTVAYGLAFAQAVEAALSLAVPARAIHLRALMLELERLANHLGDVGAICNDASFAIMLAQCGILREKVLRAADACFGHRLMMDKIVPGGVAGDLAAGGSAMIAELTREIRDRFPKLVALYDNAASLQDRTVGTGKVSAELAAQYGAGGYVGRASGRRFDARELQHHPPYERLAFQVPVLHEGDVNARVFIRIREIDESLMLIGQILGALPEGETRCAIDIVGDPGREGISLVEGFRGEILCVLRIAEDGRVASCHLRDPSWFQWPLLEAAIENNIVADFPLCNKSFNCSYSGHDL